MKSKVTSRATPAPCSSSMLTFTGQLFDPIAGEGRITRLDVARALSNLCRFNGHCEFYSVAEQNVRCPIRVRKKSRSIARRSPSGSPPRRRRKCPHRSPKA